MIYDPIGDMLTRIRNANQLHHEEVKMPSSKVKVEIAKILVEEGFIKGYTVEGDVKKTLSLSLKYGPNKEKVIQGLKRISKPGLRVSQSCENLPYVSSTLIGTE